MATPTRSTGTRVRVQQPAPAPVARQAPPPPRQAPGPRPVIRTGAGFFTKAFIWLLLLTLGAVAAGGYLIKDADGKPMGETFIAKARVLLRIDPPPTPPPPPPKLEDDASFKEIVASRKDARSFLDGASSPVGDLVPSVAAELEKRIATLTQNLETLGGLATKYPGPGAPEEISTHAKLQKDAASALSTITVALEKIAAVKAAEAAKAAQPVVVEIDLAKVNPWAGRAAETWVRWKRSAGSKLTYEDEILHPVGAGGVLSVVGFAGEAPYALPDREAATRTGKGRVVRDETLKVGDQEVACAVVESGGSTLWIPKAGRLADRVILKIASGDQSVAFTSLGEEDVALKGETKKCVRLERSGSVLWGHEDVPGFLVRVQGEGIVSEVVDWGAGARPDFPRPAKAPEASAEERDAFRRANPWSNSKPGHWTRRKAEYVSPLASAETVTDATVTEVGDQQLSLKIETLGLDGLMKVVEQKVFYAPAGAKVAGEASLDVGGEARACVILETPAEMGSIKMWVLKTGVPAVLKLESPTSSRTATSIAEETVRVGRHEVKCLRVRTEGRRDDLPIVEDVWVSAEVPGLEVRRETVQQTSVGPARSTTTLVEFGDIPARKSAIGFQKEDPARLEEQRMLKVLDDAELIVIGASGTFKEVLAASMENPRPADLGRRCDEVSAQLTKARDMYTSIKDRAPQAAGVDEKIGKIDKALAALLKIRDRK